MVRLELWVIKALRYVLKLVRVGSVVISKSNSFFETWKSNLRDDVEITGHLSLNMTHILANVLIIFFSVSRWVDFCFAFRELRVIME